MRIWTVLLAVVSIAAVALAGLVIVWSLAADAPWEGTAPESIEQPSNGDQMRCEQILELERETLADYREAIRTGVQEADTANEFYNRQFKQFESDKATYC